MIAPRTAMYIASEGVVTALALVASTLTVFGLAIDVFGLNLGEWIAFIFEPETVTSESRGIIYVIQFVAAVLCMTPITFSAKKIGRFYGTRRFKEFE